MVVALLVSPASVLWLAFVCRDASRGQGQMSHQRSTTPPTIGPDKCIEHILIPFYARYSPRIKRNERVQRLAVVSGGPGILRVWPYLELEGNIQFF
jgi:hypothetical protein